MEYGVGHFSSPLSLPPVVLPLHRKISVSTFITSMDSVSRRSYPKNKTPDRAKPWRPHPLSQPQYFTKSLRKVQVVYYLARNSGRLQHPHNIELTLPPNQPLRLKDVLNRLVTLRGSAVSSQYSWSYKRSYKKGYVWSDLRPSDIIHPSQGVEYVLKGTELLRDTTSEKIEVQSQTPNVSSSRRSLRWSPEAEAKVDEDELDKPSSFASSTTTPKSLGDGLAVARSGRWIIRQFMACGSSDKSKGKKEVRMENGE